MHALDLKVPPLLLLIICLADMLLLNWLLPMARWYIPQGNILAVCLTALGIIFTVAAVLALRRARTTVDPRTPLATETLVIHGVYRLSRNPIYVGFTLILLGVGCYLSNIVALIMVPIFILYVRRFQILPEERALLNRFGRSFTDYCQQVRRWL